MFVNNTTINKFQIDNFNIIANNEIKLSRQLNLKSRLVKLTIDLFAKRRNQNVTILNSSNFNSKFLSNKTNLDKNKKFNILILRYDAIGDYLATTPLIQLIKQNLPYCQIDIICSERNYQLISNDRNISQIYKTNSINSFITNFRQLKSQRKLNRNIQYDLIISPIFTQFTKASFIASIFQSKNTDGIMFFHDKKHQIYSSIFNLQLIKNYAELSNFDLIKQCYLYFDDNYKFYNCTQRGYVPKGKDINLQNEINKNEINKQFNSLNLSIQKYIVFNISAFTTERNLKQEFVIEFLNYIKENYLDNLNIQLFLISSPRDYNISNEIVNNFKSNSISNNNLSRIHTFQSDFTTIIQLIEHSSLVISPDTSIIHIASIFDKPTLGFYVDKHKIIEWQPYKTQFSSVLSKSNRFMEIDIKDAIEAFEDLKNRIEL